MPKEEITEIEHKKTIEEAKSTGDLNVKHFSRYGEFMASFELSKYGWDNYTPVYDEYTDLIIHKVVCNDCKKSWNTNPKLICNNCNEEITASWKGRIIANAECNDCHFKFSKSKKSNCPKCNSKNVNNVPTCPICKNGLVEIEDKSCPHCGSENHQEKFRTIQVKASRMDKKGNYAVDLRPRDFTQGSNHFYIWVCIDNEDKAHFLVVPIKEFEEVSKNFINTISFLKDQGREHFNGKTFGKYKQFVNAFDKLE